MEKRNSQVRFVRVFFDALQKDVATFCPSYNPTSDFKTFSKRLDLEGIGFVTKTLPSLGKAVLRSLETGLLSFPSTFKKSKKGNFPKFLEDLFCQCYSVDGSTIVSVSNPCREIVNLYGLLRQLTMFAYKLDLPLSDKQKEEAEQIGTKGFILTDRSLYPNSALPPASEKVLSRARRFAQICLKDFNPDNIFPHHGPGSVATGELGDSKWSFSRKYEILHESYPYYKYFIVGKSHLLDRLCWYKSLEKRSFAIAKLLFVPKDSRGPRVISMEPLELMFIQQGLKDKLQKFIERSQLMGGRINFENQNINRSLSLIGSINGSFATLDMKDASDRVSLSLVQEVLRSLPLLRKRLEATRSQATRLPDGSVHLLQKFAPMGSALCFPVEALIFFFLACASISVEEGKPFSQVSKHVYIYGDDIIVKSAYACHVQKHFPSFGLLFNGDKCFVNGPFRESCGIESLLGFDICPTYWRKPWPQSIKDATSVVSAVAFSNNLYLRGYWHAASCVAQSLSAVVGEIPVVPSNWNPGYLALISHSQNQPRMGKCIRKWNKKLQVNQYRLLSPFLKSKGSKTDSWERLLCNLLTGPPASQPVSRDLALKHVWMS